MLLRETKEHSSNGFADAMFTDNLSDSSPGLVLLNDGHNLGFTKSRCFHFSPLCEKLIRILHFSLAYHEGKLSLATTIDERLQTRAVF